MRVCGACLPSGVKPIGPRWGCCGACGTWSELVDDTPPQPIRVPSPRSVPPASGWARLRKLVAS